MKAKFFVEGDPVAQGSMKHVGGGRIIHNNQAELNAWRATVAWQAKLSTQLPKPIGDEVEFWMRLGFYLRRPRTVTRVLPSVKPDVDKLTRSILDALEGVIYANDGQVVNVLAAKFYAKPGEAGVYIHIATDSRDE